MTIVNQQLLTEKIKRLESRGNAEYALGLTLNEEFQIKAYRLLLGYMQGCSHTYGRTYSNSCCSMCGEHFNPEEPKLGIGGLDIGSGISPGVHSSGVKKPE